MKLPRSSLILTFLLVIAAAICVNGQTVSPTPTQPSPSTVETPTKNAQPSVDDAVPNVLKDPVLLQKILARAEYDRTRADAAERAAAEWKEQALKWQIALKASSEENERLRAANTKLELSYTEQRAANGYLQTSVNDYKSEISDLRRDNERLRSRQKYLLLGGAVVGASVCYLRNR